MKERTLFRTQSMDEADVMARFSWEHDLLGNVTTQSETWPGEPTRPGTRSTSMAYDANNRLIHETVNDTTAGVTTTAYAYDAANNRSSKQVTGGAEPGVWSYQYNAANQLTSWEKRVDNIPVKSAALTYDAAGNRTGQSVTTLNSEPATLNTTYAWDAQDRLASVTLPATVVAGVSTPSTTHSYEYDYRTRRIGTLETPSPISNPPSAAKHTAIVFAGGLSLAEWESPNLEPETLNSVTPSVQYVRGPDMGGGVGGMLYSLRGGTTKYSLSNGRGDIVAQADQGANLTWTASYEAYGKRTKETGTNLDKQRANSKDEDPTGLLNEGFRYRDIETGVWLSRDPAGFVDGPNLYAYVMQNPWTGWDPHGLRVEVKRTPKASKDKPPAGMNKMQLSAWNNEQQKKDHGHHTEITVTAALLDETSTGHSPEDLAAIRDQIANSVKEKFTGQDGKDSWSMKFDLRIVKSAKEIKEDDHEIILKDFVLAKSLSAKEFGGYALVSDKQFEKGQHGLGGNTIALSGKSIFDAQGKPNNYLNWLAPHEVGHTLGLSHPNDPNNPLSSNPGARNLMWHKPPLGPQSNQVNKQQIDAVGSNFADGKLNQGRSSISEAFFYFSEKQFNENK